MDNSVTFNQIEKLFNKIGFKKPICEPKKVAGGLMHTMYEVTTENTKYAVKEFNSSIMKRNNVKENIMNSEKVAKSLSATVPVIAALEINDISLIESDGMYYMIFDWIDGASIFPAAISLENCAKIGTLLGKMHSADIRLPEIQYKSESSEIFNWDKYLLLGHETNSEWHDELSQMIGDLKKWNKESADACSFLSKHVILSHRDLDPKNVMWNNDNPYFIDWEAAGYVNPYQELLGLMNDWSDNGQGQTDKSKFDAFYHSYLEVVGIFQIDWEKVLLSGYSGMLGWLNYNLKRSLGIESSSTEEKNLGTGQVFDTMKSLRKYANQATTLKSWLDIHL